MAPDGTDKKEESATAEAPEDAAGRYSWANLHGAKYRDFSASRREDRAQLRHRAAQQVREQALLGQVEAARLQQSGSFAQHSLREAEEAFRAAAAERIEAARRAEAAAVAEGADYREVREIAETQVPNHVSLQQQELPTRGPLQTASRRRGDAPNRATGVRRIYREPGAGIVPDNVRPTDSERSSTPAQGRSSPRLHEMKPMPPEQPIPSRTPSAANERQSPFIGKRHTDPKPSFPEDTSGAASSDSPAQRQAMDRRSMSSGEAVSASPMSPFSQTLIQSRTTRGRRAQDDSGGQRAQDSSQSTQRVAPDPVRESPSSPAPGLPHAIDAVGPAWFYAATAAQTPEPSAPQPSVADTLQYSRERVASRWFALKGVFEQSEQEHSGPLPIRQKETRTPVLAVFSLAGGVGKTSLVATVGRSLSSMGEKVLLTDLTSHGLLPFYFGANELRQGTVRSFSPPSGSTDVPVYLVGCDVEQKGSDEAAQESLVEEILSSSQGTHRILLDLASSASWMVRMMACMNPTVLVPVAPDMNSVIILQSVEKFFHSILDGDGRPLQPYYVINQFDTSLPLHLDVREVLRRQLGDRLLPFVIRRAPSVSEALAEGMTVVDYAPDTPVAGDYLNVANWLRTVAAPAVAGFRNVRWSER